MHKAKIHLQFLFELPKSESLLSKLAESVQTQTHLCLLDILSDLDKFN